MPQGTEEQCCLNCGQPPLPAMPFPLCLKCASVVMRHVWVKLGSTADRQFEPKPEAPIPSPHVVYYVELAGLIKIGTTGNIRERLEAFPPIARLIAIERGGYDTERQRHQQFAALRVQPANRGHGGRQSEWFRDHPSLRAHIAKLPRPTVS